MASAEGYARPSRFAIRLFPPTSLLQEIKLQNSTTNREGQVLDNEMYNGDGQVQSYASGVLRKLTQTYGRQINIHCDSVTMPGRDLTQQEVQYGTDVKRNMVQAHTYEGNITATFYADKYMRERTFMEAWQNICVDPVSHTAGYYDDYVGKMHIYQLAADSEIGRDMPSYAIEAMDVYPATIGVQELSYSAEGIAKVTVQFAYKQWRNLGSETSGIDFGHSMQTAADVKSRTPGILDRLPPSLTRGAKGVLSQARTVLNPVGKIFKGKVFPPFT
jgi:hypothetical protein